MVTKKEHVLVVSEGPNRLEISQSETYGKYHGYLVLDTERLKSFALWKVALAQKRCRVSDDAHGIFALQAESDFTRKGLFIAEFVLFSGVETFVTPPTKAEVLDLVRGIKTEKSNLLLGLALRLLLSDEEIICSLKTTMLLLMEERTSLSGESFFLNPNTLERGNNLGAYAIADKSNVFPKDAYYVFATELNEPS